MSPLNIQISKATVTDTENINALIIESSRGMYELCGWSPKDVQSHFPTGKTKESTEKLAETISNLSDADILLVAKLDNNKVVGCCFANQQEQRNIMDAIYILPDFQGLGLATELFNEAYKQLNQKKDTYLEVFSLNTKAINFYRELGFFDTGMKTFDKRFSDASGKQLEITEMVLAATRD